MFGLAFMSVAFAGDPTLSIQVVDGQGEPVRGAMVVYVPEGEKHSVNSDTGMWTTSMFYLPDGSEVPIEKDVRYAFWVGAPDYLIQSFEVVADKKKTKKRVTLEKFQVTAPQTADPSAKPALEAYAKWMAAWNAHVAAPSNATLEASRGLRTEAGEALRVWLDRAKSENKLAAWTACMYVGSATQCGERP